MTPARESGTRWTRLRVLGVLCLAAPPLLLGLWGVLMGETLLWSRTLGTEPIQGLRARTFGAMWLVMGVTALLLFLPAVTQHKVIKYVDLAILIAFSLAMLSIFIA